MATLARVTALGNGQPGGDVRAQPKAPATVPRPPSALPLVRPHSCRTHVAVSKRRAGAWNPMCMCLFGVLGDGLVRQLMTFLHNVTDLPRLALVSTRFTYLISHSRTLFSTVTVPHSAAVPPAAVLSTLAARGPSIRGLALPRFRPSAADLRRFTRPLPAPVADADGASDGGGGAAVAAPAARPAPWGAGAGVGSSGGAPPTSVAPPTLPAAVPAAPSHTLPALAPSSAAAVSLASLETLSLPRALLPPGTVAAMLRTAPRLHTLVLDASAVDAEVLAAVSGCQALRVLSLRGCRTLTAAALERLRVPSLASLDVSSCGRGVTAAAVAGVAVASPALTSLCARGVALGDAELAAIAAACPHVTRLEFGSGNPFGRASAASPLTAAGLAALAAALPGLQRLACTGGGTSTLTDADVAAAVAQLPALHAVDLSGHVGVGDAAARALGTRCQALQHVNLFRCRGVGDAGVGHLLSLSDLRHVDVRECDLVSPAGHHRVDAAGLLPPTGQQL